LAAEDLTSKLTPWPKEVDRRSSPRRLGQHLLLKAVASAVVCPFYSASLVESIQVRQRKLANIIALHFTKCQDYYTVLKYVYVYF